MCRVVAWRQTKIMITNDVVSAGCRTALMVASTAGELAVVKFMSTKFKENGLDPNEKDEVRI